MKIAQLASGLELYDSTQEDFINGYQLPEELFERPDHLTVRCGSVIDYFETCLQLADHCLIDEGGVWELAIEDRLMSSMGLARAIDIAERDFDWMRVMKAAAGDQAYEGFVESAEYYYPDPFRVEEILRQRGISYSIHFTCEQTSLNVVMDNEGRGIRFNDWLIKDRVAYGRRAGLLHQLRSEGQYE